MKILPYLILLLSPGIVSAAPEPEQLLRLRKAWENSVAGVQERVDAFYHEEMNAVHKRYHEELLAMKGNFMEAKNLEGAVAVDAEIKKLVAEHGKQKFKPSRDERATGKNTSPLDGVWIHPNATGKHLMVLKGTKMANSAGEIADVTYQNQTVIIYWAKNGWTHKLSQDPANPDLLVGVNNKGKKVTYERLKW